MYAGVDLGGTTIACAVASDGGEIVRERSVPTQSNDGPQKVLARISELVSELAAGEGKLLALGMGVPGLLDIRRGRALFLPNFPTQWRDIAVAAELARPLGCPVHLLNDARLATLGELTFGHGRTADSMVLFTLGTGVGGGVVIDRKLRLGALGAAGEIGHQTVVPDGLRCGCGNRGCLETVASGPALAAEGVRLMRSGLAPRLHELVGGEASAVGPKEMAAAAAAGDNNVREAIVRAARYLGIGASNLVTALHPQMIVLAGGVAAIGDLLIETVRAGIRERVRMFPPDDVRVERSMLGDQAGVLGGIALAMRGGQV
ncbi:MAG TPA: ROK family protein [Bryobacteraceae bacterium]|nr:ROK family protein [Bryobacteraceae bacterium]